MSDERADTALPDLTARLLGELDEEDPSRLALSLRRVIEGVGEAGPIAGFSQSIDGPGRPPA